MGEWQPIETAPYGRVLGWIRPPDKVDMGWEGIIWKDGNDEWFDDGGDDLAPYIATHWMPLPGAPK